MQNRISELSSIQADVKLDFSEEDNDENEKYMPEFFAEVGNVKTSMSLIRRNLKAIQDAYEKQSVSVSNQSNELDELMDATNSASGQIRTALRKMKEETDSLEPTNPQKRVRINMHAVLTKKFMSLLNEYQTIQTQFRDKTKAKLIRQATIVKPGVTEAEIEVMLNSGGDLFGDKIMAETKHTEAKNALKMIQEQQRDLQHLEEHLHELHQMFIEMGTMVELATENITKTEIIMDTSHLNALAAAKNVSIAHGHEQSRRRKILLVTTVILTLLLVAAGVVAILFGTGAIKT